MPIPFIDLSRLTKEIADDVRRDWSECLDRCEFVGGPRVATLERTLASKLGVPYAVSCGNGTDALILALQALGVERGMKVAVPNLTFWATYEAVVNLGAVPVLVDVNPEDLAMDLDELKRAHETHGLSAILFVHLFGWTSGRLREIREFCRARGIRMVEDGAQCYGVELDGKPVLADADAATLSFYPAKVLGGAMDGGAILFREEARAALARSLANHGRSEHYSYAHVGWNSRMGGLQAAFLLRALEKSDSILASRRRAAHRYRELLAGIPGVRVYGPPPSVTENGYLNVMAVEGVAGDALAQRLRESGVSVGRTYPETMDEQKPVQGALRVGDLAHSKAFCRNVVNLPLFYGIRDDEVEAAVRALRASLGASA